MRKIVFIMLLAVFLVMLVSCEEDADEQSGVDNDSYTDSYTGNDAGDFASDSDVSGDSGTEDSDVYVSDMSPDDDAVIKMDCEPGKTMECYEGPQNTAGNGSCVKGTMTCVPDGSGWGACKGQVLPTMEICGDGIDQDCDGADLNVGDPRDVDEDGDGVSICGGDCCDTQTHCPDNEPALVNPDAIELADGFDNNCDGLIDNIPVCDDALDALTAVSDDVTSKRNGAILAKAMGICGSDLIDAQITLTGTVNADGFIKVKKTDDDDITIIGSNNNYPYFKNGVAQYGVIDAFGTGGIIPFEGTKMAILSTGDWKNPTRDEWDTGVSGGNMQTRAEIPQDWANMQYNCSTPTPQTCAGYTGSPPVTPSGDYDDQCGTFHSVPSGQDPIMLTLRLKVPESANSFKLKVKFFSYEYPKLVCSQYNDFFVALLDSTYTSDKSEENNPHDKNIGKTEQGTPLGINLGREGLFTTCSTSCVEEITIPMQGTFTYDTNQWGFCNGEDELNGTGFHSTGSTPNCKGSGATQWLTVQGNVVPGETITLRLAVWEMGDFDSGGGDHPDHSYDTTVLLDSFQWMPRPVHPGTYDGM